VAAVQRNDAWVKAATPEQIDVAHEAGELDEILGVQRNEAGNRISDLKGVSR
jgi:hypothetical protein